MPITCIASSHPITWNPAGQALWHGPASSSDGRGGSVMYGYGMRGTKHGNHQSTWTLYILYGLRRWCLTISRIDPSRIQVEDIRNRCRWVEATDLKVCLVCNNLENPRFPEHRISLTVFTLFQVCCMLLMIDVVLSLKNYLDHSQVHHFIDDDVFGIVEWFMDMMMHSESSGDLWTVVIQKSADSK